MLRIEERCSLFLSSLLNIFLWEDGFSALQKETKVKNLIHFSPHLMQLSSNMRFINCLKKSQVKFLLRKSPLPAEGEIFIFPIDSSRLSLTLLLISFPNL